MNLPERPSFDRSCSGAPAQAAVAGLLLQDAFTRHGSELQARVMGPAAENVMIGLIIVRERS